ncbi:TetR/AcrR family transcriptional regulator [Nocardia yamanashiensis]|uniref:TetR/AcrR family transcriptional regulator n=1 Tax=Nocardia yamanashiensis TaxID=209247 RepID=UPI001E2ABCFC|nr:TetR/AcrR family transcriptional regulator [Nocardia yamanashiensis]UGT41590.1 TetR/AcrR family transcriptional regulator [Nocardia yamanashiensis]
MTKAKQAGGRPRQSRVDTSIATAVRVLIAERGYASLTVDAVALQAGVSKAAIYRRYATKQEMIFSVLLHDLREQPPADTGTLRGDLGALTEQIAAQVTASAATLTGLLADIRADPALTARFAGAFLPVERAIIATVLDRAVARGELSHRPEPALVQALLLGPLYAWLVVLDENPVHTRELADLVAAMTATALVSDQLPDVSGAVESSTR